MCVSFSLQVMEITLCEWNNLAASFSCVLVEAISQNMLALVLVEPTVRCLDIGQRVVRVSTTGHLLPQSGRPCSRASWVCS